MQDLEIDPEQRLSCNEHLASLGLMHTHAYSLLFQVSFYTTTNQLG